LARANSKLAFVVCIQLFLSQFVLHDQCLIQVKGGHIVVAGVNSTTGILVDMVLFNLIYYNPRKGFVDVSDGQKWDNVYTALAAYNVHVNGVTTCTSVGVAGFNLGGGYRNKTNQYGLAIDKIEVINIVLPMGEIVRANE
jgi:FAD/FMN-containing dehydrogenase